MAFVGWLSFVISPYSRMERETPNPMGELGPPPNVSCPAASFMSKPVGGRLEAINPRRAVIGLANAPSWATKLQGILVAIEGGRNVTKVLSELGAVEALRAKWPLRLEGVGCQTLTLFSFQLQQHGGEHRCPENPGTFIAQSFAARSQVQFSTFAFLHTT
jgi:hypothetical protein